MKCRGKKVTTILRARAIAQTSIHTVQFLSQTDPNPPLLVLGWPTSPTSPRSRSQINNPKPTDRIQVSSPCACACAAAAASTRNNQGETGRESEINRKQRYRERPCACERDHRREKENLDAKMDRLPPAGDLFFLLFQSLLLLPRGSAPHTENPHDRFSSPSSQPNRQPPSISTCLLPYILAPACLPLPKIPNPT